MDGRWKSLKLNEQMASISAHTLQLIADCRPKLPEYVTKNRKYGGRMDASVS
jgi:hypothetical protein